MKYPESRVVRRPVGRDPGDEDAVIIPAERRRAAPASNGQSQAAGRAADADLVLLDLVRGLLQQGAVVQAIVGWNKQTKHIVS